MPPMPRQLILLPFSDTLQDLEKLRGVTIQNFPNANPVLYLLRRGRVELYENSTAQRSATDRVLDLMMYEYAAIRLA